jgi:hypothetical protein
MLAKRIVRRKNVSRTSGDLEMKKRGVLASGLSFKTVALGFRGFRGELLRFRR